jgi:hypothetical protein
MKISGKILALKMQKHSELMQLKISEPKYIFNQKPLKIIKK